MPLLPLLSAFLHRLVSRARAGQPALPDALRRDDQPRSAEAYAHHLLAGQPRPTPDEWLDALSQGIAWANEDPYLWERRVVPNPGGAGFTVPFVKIGRRRP